MRIGLRGKLLLVLPLLGLVPWLGLRYFDATTQVVDHSQLQSTRQVGLALVPILAQQAWPESSPTSIAAATQLSIYALAQPLTLDGFFDDWPEHHRSTNLGRLNVRVAQLRQQLYLALEVTDASRVYAKPGQRRVQPAAYDYIDLQWAQGQQRVRLMAEAPGRFKARRIEGTRLGREVAIDAVWWERSAQYQLELQLPLSLLDGARRMTLTLHDAGAPPAAPSSQTLELQLTPLQPELQQLLSRYSQTEQHLMLLGKHGEVVALSEGLGPRSLGGLKRFAASGLAQQAEQGWSRVRLPVVVNGQPQAELIVQRVSDAVSLIQRKTLFDLGWKTLVVVLLLVFGLLLFGSRLAFRIRRLGRQFRAQFDDQGRVLPQQPLAELKASDEVGGLSRDLDQMLQRLQSYTQFLERMPRTLRHELSNPLNTISTSLQLIEVEDAQQRILEAAQRGVERLEKTIDSITEAASLEQALSRESNQQLDLVAFLPRYLERCYISFSGRQFELELNGLAVVEVTANDLRLEQLLDKLIDNAVDFSPLDQPVRLVLSRDSDGVTLQVSNRGPVIEPQQAEQLFELFSGNRQDGSGSHLGLGLYVVKLLAGAFGAQARIFSDAGWVRVEVVWPQSS